MTLIATTNRGLLLTMRRLFSALAGG